MLRLFRSTRQNLLNDNKTVKYLKYALGEVLLIMVGIFLALQLNNWNEQRKQDQVRRELIENLKIDFQNNLALLKERIPIRKGAVDDIGLFLSYAAAGNQEVSVDKLRSLADKAYTGSPFQLNLGTYEAALSSGSISLLGDPTTNQLFSQLEANIVSGNQVTELVSYDQFVGANRQLWGKLGDLNVLRGNDVSVPDSYQLSDEEYRSLIAQKEVYAVFDAKRSMRERQYRRLVEMKEITDQILAALEAL